MPIESPVTPRIMKRLPFLLIAFGAACTSGSKSTEITTRDSAGVTIIEHPAGAIAAAPRWTLGEPTVTIGHGATEEELFTRISGAARLADGRIVVINAEDNGAQPLLYAADGTFERPLGRMGEGPGEFRAGNLLNCRAADTLCIFDFNTRRITRMTTAGTMAGITPLGRFTQRDLGFPRGMLPDGRLVSVPFVFDTLSLGDNVFRSPNAVVIIDPAAGTVDTLTAKLPGSATYIGTLSFAGRSNAFPMPAGYGAQSLIMVVGDQLLVATNEGTDIITYSLPWVARRIVRFHDPSTPVDAAARQAFIDGALKDIQRMTAPSMAAFRDQMSDQVRQTRFVDSMAFYSMGRVATDGSLWLLRTASPADSTRSILVVGPEGKLAAQVTIPDDAVLYWASDSAVLLTRRDEDDVMRIELRSIIRPGASP